MSIVRNNLMTREGYSPYCGNNNYGYGKGQCHMPRTFFNGDQFECPVCGFVSQFEESFIQEYKTKWGITGPHPGESNSSHEIFSRSLHRSNALAQQMKEAREKVELERFQKEFRKNPEVANLERQMDQTTEAINALKENNGFVDFPAVWSGLPPQYRVIVKDPSRCQVVSKKHRVRLMRIQNSSGFEAVYVDIPEYSTIKALEKHGKGQGYGVVQCRTEKGVELRLVAFTVAAATPNKNAVFKDQT